MKRATKIGLVFFFVVVCAIALHSRFEIRQKPPAPVELYDVVFRQFNAFQASDYSSAYQQVSTNFQEKFDLNAFTDLVRTDYPDLLRADHLEFGPVLLAPNRALIQVYFVLADGDVVPCVYCLINEHRIWKIESARVQKRWQPGKRLGGTRI